MDKLKNMKRLYKAVVIVMCGMLCLFTVPQLLSDTEPAASTQHYENPAIDMYVLSEEALRNDAQRRLPLTYWSEHKSNTSKFSCAPFPLIHELEFTNTYWQILRSSNGTFHLYGAYFDKRDGSAIGPSVRLLAIYDGGNPTLTTHCQFWFQDRNIPVVVRNLWYIYMWHSEWTVESIPGLKPYLLTCLLPPEVRHLVPTSVSLVEFACDRATNNLRVYYDYPSTPRKHFAVCVKSLDFLHEDRSIRLIEWIELVRLLGADKIFFYELQVHPNMTKVLEYYKAHGVVSVTPFTLPAGQSNLPYLQHIFLTMFRTYKRQIELIPYNDCLYRHMYKYRWLTLLDIDEVIVPVESPDWAGLMSTVLPLSTFFPGQGPHSSYYASNVYFLDSLSREFEEDVPSYMHLLQHVYRAQNFSEPLKNVKAFHETDRVLVLHNHLPLACLGGRCSNLAMEVSHARLHHYRTNCHDLDIDCDVLRADPVRDTTLWRWRKQLVLRTDYVLGALGFLSTS